MPAYAAAPSATTSSGFAPLLGFSLKIRSTMRCTAGHRVMPPTSRTSSTSLGVEAGVRERAPARRLDAIEQILRELLELVARHRALEVDRRAVLIVREERQLDHGLALRPTAPSSRSRSLAQPRQRHRHAGEIDAVLIEHLVDDALEHAAIPVLAAERAVAAGREHLEDAVLDGHDRDVERAAAEIEHRDQAAALAHAMRAVRERGRGRLVEDADDVEAGDLAGVARRLALRVVEVRGHGDHRARDRLAERFLGDLRASGAARARRPPAG